MAVRLLEPASLLLLVYENKDNYAAAHPEIRRLKNFRKGSFLQQVLGRIIVRFEKTGHLGVLPRQGSKPFCSDVVAGLATTIVEQLVDNVEGCSSTHAMSRHLNVPYNILSNVLRIMVHCFP